MFIFRYLARGNPDLAVEQYSQALDIQLRTLDHDDEELAATHSSLGTSFLRLMQPEPVLSNRLGFAATSL